MPTEKPRINVTLPDEVFDTVCDLAELQGVSASHVVRQLLETSLVSLQQVADLMRELKGKEKQLLKDYDEAQKAALEQFEAAIAEALAGRPEVITRPSDQDAA